MKNGTSAGKLQSGERGTNEMSPSAPRLGSERLEKGLLNFTRLNKITVPFDHLVNKEFWRLIRIGTTRSTRICDVMRDTSSSIG